MTSPTEVIDTEGPNETPSRPEKPCLPESLPTAQSDDVDASLDFALSLRKVRRPSVVLGPAIWILGALLWAFVVFGEFASAGLIGEWLAGLSVVLITSGAWYLAVRRTLAVRLGPFGMLGRTLTPFALALVAAALAALVLRAIGESNQKDVPATLSLMLLGAVALLGGRRWTGGRDVDLLPRWLVVILTGASVVVSIAAVVHVFVTN